MTYPPHEVHPPREATVQVPWETRDGRSVVLTATAVLTAQGRWVTWHAIQGADSVYGIRWSDADPEEDPEVMASRHLLSAVFGRIAP